MTYRPDIDGLRAIAVLAVLAFHYALPGFDGGFVGVDVFFVISGFLITGLLRHQAAAGPVSIAGFFGRRIRRILPALSVVLLATVAAGQWLLMPGDYASLGESAAFAAAGAGNVFFFLNTGYFDRESELQPLLHTWSLGVEEQFYLVWPFLILGAVRLSRRWAWAPVLAIGGVLAASFASSAVVMVTAPKASFYLSHLRAWELATGALVTFAPVLVSRFWSTAVGTLGLGLVAFAVLTLGAADPFPGWNAVAPVAGAALLVWPRQGDLWCTRLLARRPLQHIGLVSYSLYLWHWPVLVFYRHYIGGEMPDGVTRIGLALVSYAMALLSWWLVEQPARRFVARPRTVLVVGVASICALLALGATVRRAEGFPGRFGDDLAGMESLQTMWDWPCPRTEGVEGLGALCSFGRPWQDAATRGVLWGDSHAEHMAPIVEAATAGRDVSFVLLPMCPAVFDDDVRREWPEVPGYAEDCADRRRRALALLKAIPRVDVVMLASAWLGTSRVVSARPGSGLPSGGQALIEEGMTRLFEAAAAPSRKFVIIGQVPQFPGDPVPCLVAAPVIFRRGCDTLGHRIAESFGREQRPLDVMFERIAASRADVFTILPGERLCGDGTCLTTLDGQPLYRDGNHIRRNLRPSVRLAYAERIGMVKLFDTLLGAAPATIADTAR